jgi:hypothetical protein
MTNEAIIAAKNRIDDKLKYASLKSSTSKFIANDKLNSLCSYVFTYQPRKWNHLFYAVIFFITTVTIVYRVSVRVMVFNATFNNISVISCGSHFYWLRKPDYPEKTIDLCNERHN